MAPPDGQTQYYINRKIKGKIWWNGAKMSVKLLFKTFKELEGSDAQPDFNKSLNAQKVIDTSLISCDYFLSAGRIL